MKLNRIFRSRVAAGVPPAVEPGVSPGGMNVGTGVTLANSNAGPGGKMPPSTAGGTPAATAAFTMVEIAIALGIIGFALVAIIGILPAGMSVQKDNREETLINFDATFLMNAIRNGAQGQDDLTNYIIAITNNWAIYDTNNNFIRSDVDWYTTLNYHIGGVGTFTTFALTNGSNIVGILSTPKYLPWNAGQYRSNSIAADFRAITGAALDQGTNANSQEFAFKYRVFPEIIPTASYAYNGQTWMNFTAPALTTATNPLGPLAVAPILQTNFNQIRLRFRWPVLPSGALGNGRQVFRGSASGATMSTNSPTVKGVVLYYVQPQLL